jgi:hypothetical protein
VLIAPHRMLDFVLYTKNDSTDLFHIFTHFNSQYEEEFTLSNINPDHVVKILINNQIRHTYRLIDRLSAMSPAFCMAYGFYLTQHLIKISHPLGLWLWFNTWIVEQTRKLIELANDSPFSTHLSSHLMRTRRRRSEKLVIVVLAIASQCSTYTWT